MKHYRSKLLLTREKQFYENIIFYNKRWKPSQEELDEYHLEVLSGGWEL